MNDLVHLPRIADAAGTILRNGGIVAAAVLATTALPAGAMQSAPSPIEIRSCTPVYASLGMRGYFTDPPRITGIQIDFVNRAPVAAEAVTFLVGDRNDASATVADRGSFAPGVEIRHTFATTESADACRVLAAHFSGGTAFLAASTGAQPLR